MLHIYALCVRGCQSGLATRELGQRKKRLSALKNSPAADTGPARWTTLKEPQCKNIYNLNSILYESEDSVKWIWVISQLVVTRRTLKWSHIYQQGRMSKANSCSQEKSKTVIDDRGNSEMLMTDEKQNVNWDGNGTLLSHSPTGSIGKSPVCTWSHLSI